MQNQPLSTSPRTEASAGTLLVTDDSLIIRQIIKDMATNAGWTVIGEASNGQEAIERYRQLRPDAVTLDLVMPEHDGLYALRGIMQFDPQAKVLLVSAVEQRGVLKDAFKAGAADFVAKPFDKENLLATLALLLQKAGE
jgi:two-component system chemotaxis response regulator CheY